MYKINVASNNESQNNNVVDFQAKQIKEPKYKQILIDDLKIANYQREPKYEKCKKYADNFDTDILGIVLVSFRDNAYWIVDGQHRVKTLRLVKIKQVMCQILEGLTYEQEAAKFLKLNNERTGLNANQKFHAQVEALDKHALDIVKILSDNEYKYTANHTCKSRNYIAAVGTIQEIYKGITPKGLDRELKILRKAWNGDKDSLSVQILKGLYTFIKMYSEVFEDEILIEAIRLINPKDIETDALRYVKSLLRPSRGDSSCEHIAKIFWNHYNNSAKGKMRKLPHLFDVA